MMVGIHLAKMLHRVQLALTQPSKGISFFDALLPGTAAWASAIVRQFAGFGKHTAYN
jgi:hypothetical protein